MALARLLLVEDEQFTRTLLGTSLSSMGFQIMGACATARQAIDIVATSECDVALLDLDLGSGPSGVDVAYALRAVDSDLGLIFLTSFTDPRIKDPTSRELPVGSRFIVKSQLNDFEVLRMTILATKQAPLTVREAESRATELTANQVEVLRRIAAGDTNQVIAAQLGVSEKAIEGTIHRICELLGVDRTGSNVRVLLTRAYAELAGKTLPQ